MTLTPSAAPMRVKLRDRRDLREAMFFARLNVRQLADIVGPRHRSTIGHLHSGARDTCPVFLGRRLEEVLRMHPGSLFVPVGRSANVVTTTAAPTTRKKAA